MKYQKIIVFSSLIAVIGVALYYVISNRATISNKPTEVFNQANQQSSLLTQTATIGDVTYTVTPKGLSQSSATWGFEVVLDTHTGSLDQDLTQQVTLLDDRGKEYQSAKWEGDPSGGHHRKGQLQFKSLGADIKSVILKINPGENMGEASFTWNVEK